MKNILVIGPTYIDDNIVVDKLNMDASCRVLEKKSYLGGTGLSLAYYFSELNNPVGLITVAGKKDYKQVIKNTLKFCNVDDLTQLRTEATDRSIVLTDPVGNKLCISDRKISDTLVIDPKELGSLLNTYRVILITTVSIKLINLILTTCNRLSYRGRICIILNQYNARSTKLTEALSTKFPIYYLNMSLPEQKCITKFKDIVKNCNIITVTDGKNGSTIYFENIKIRIPAYKENVTNSNSAGEAYTAAFLTSLLSDNGPVKSGYFAAKFTSKMLVSRDNLLRKPLKL
jgi:sugar/nucleoside kinase (ribokinase family)